MAINWLRVLVGGFLIELLLIVVLAGGFAAAGVDLAKGVSALAAYGTATFITVNGMRLLGALLGGVVSKPRHA